MSTKVKRNITLSGEPIRDAKGEMTTEITFRKMRVGDLRIFDETKGEQDAMIRLVAALASLPPSSVENIDIDDWPRIMEMVSGFLQGLSPKTQTAEPKVTF